jgi:hypothetical protein
MRRHAFRVSIHGCPDFHDSRLRKYPLASQNALAGAREVVPPTRPTEGVFGSVNLEPNYRVDFKGHLKAPIESGLQRISNVTVSMLGRTAAGVADNWGIYVTAYEDDSQGCVLTSSDDFYGNITSYAPVPVNTVQRFIRWGSAGHIEEAWEPQYR